MIQDVEQTGNTQDVLHFTVTRLRQLSTLSNMDIDQVFELAGVNLDNVNEEPINQQAYWKLMKMNQEEREKLQQFGKALFENKLTNWLPRL